MSVDSFVKTAKIHHEDRRLVLLYCNLYWKSPEVESARNGVTAKIAVWLPQLNLNLA